MVHNNAAFIVKYVFVAASLVRTPVCHNCLSSSTNGLRKTSMSFPGDLGPGINKVNMNVDSRMHSQGGRLYVVSITGHVL
ncbi:hypothetical protein HanOQP8_Chr08g0268981 [Helianthus annuus]|nr:hypothetical protein HanHA89_Chr08g0279591 [Helianthus annuus]KAJ0720877.1 hypothetical protein HanOQP8_Chr08g0268981 [Helianthus annuus]